MKSPRAWHRGVESHNVVRGRDVHGAAAVVFAVVVVVADEKGAAACLATRHSREARWPTLCAMASTGDGRKSKKRRYGPEKGPFEASLRCTALLVVVVWVSDGGSG